MDASRILRYGTLRDHPNSCPWSYLSKRSTGLGVDNEEMCQVHKIVIARQATAIKPSCQCDIWTTGCICGAFAQEKKSPTQ